jgi:hypothetical protein
MDRLAVIDTESRRFAEVLMSTDPTSRCGAGCLTVRPDNPAEWFSSSPPTPGPTGSSTPG